MIKIELLLKNSYSVKVNFLNFVFVFLKQQTEYLYGWKTRNRQQLAQLNSYTLKASAQCHLPAGKKL